MLTTLRFVELLALGVWVGAMVFFAFFVAPAAFTVLPLREQAGNLVAWLLPRLHLLGVVCGLAFLGAAILEQQLSDPANGGAGGGLRALLVPAALIGVIFLLTAYNHFGLGQRLAALRAEMTATFGSVDHTPRDNALRLAFGRLHGWSSLVLSVNLLLLLGVVAATARRLR